MFFSFLQNPKLQDDIDRNLKLREGAARILSMAANSIHRLDAAKTVLVSNARLLVSMQQLQREKTDEVAAIDNSATPSNNAGKRFGTGKATLCLSGMFHNQFFARISMLVKIFVMLILY